MTQVLACSITQWRCSVSQFLGNALLGGGINSPIAAAPIGYLVYDDFVGENGVSLDERVPEIAPAGAAWSVGGGSYAINGSGQALETGWHWGFALLDLGVSTYEVRLKAQAPLNNDAGLCFEASADGTNRQFLILAPANHLYQHRRGDGETVNIYNATIAADTYYWLKVIAGPLCRLWHSSDGETWTYLAVMPRINAAYTHVGIANYFTGAGLYDTFLAYSSGTDWPRIIGIGDSIMQNTALYDIGSEMLDGRLIDLNHAVGGNSIADHMAAQVTAAADDNGDYAIIHLGTNDGSAEGREAIYTAQIAALYASNPNLKTIGCITRGPDLGGDSATTIAVNAAIAAAVTAAATAGAPCEYWDTRVSLVNPDNAWIDPATDTIDGTHLNASGTEKFRHEIMLRIP